MEYVYSIGFTNSRNPLSSLYIFFFFALFGTQQSADRFNAIIERENTSGNTTWINLYVTDPLGPGGMVSAHRASPPLLCRCWFGRCGAGRCLNCCCCSRCLGCWRMPLGCGRTRYGSPCWRGWGCGSMPTRLTSNPKTINWNLLRRNSLERCRLGVD